VDKGKDGNDHEIFLDTVKELPDLLKARKEYAYGLQRDYFDFATCIGWTREGDDEHSGCAVVLSNGDTGTKYMEVGKRYAGKMFYDLLQKHEQKIEINEEGWAEFLTPAGSVSVWVLEE
jgi:alpha-amylase